MVSRLRSVCLGDSSKQRLPAADPGSGKEQQRQQQKQRKLETEKKKEKHTDANHTRETRSSSTEKFVPRREDRREKRREEVVIRE